MTIPRRAHLLWAVCIFILLAACGDDDPQQTATPAPTLTLFPATATATPAPPTETPLPQETVNPLGVLPPTPTFAAPRGLPNEASRAIDAAFADAEARFELTRDDLNLLGIKVVTWRVPDLVCQNDPLGYGALAADRNAGLPGFRLVLGDESPSVYVYFADFRGNAIYCPNANLLDTRGTALHADPLGAELAALARLEFANRLNVPVDAVRVVDMLNITWLDSSLGCPQPDSNPTAQNSPGYRIALDYRGDIAVYHADFRAVTFCPDGRELLPRPFEATPTPTITPTPEPTAIPES